MAKADDLIALAEDYEDKARALRIAHTLLTGEQHAAALKSLPTKLRAASKLRGGSGRPVPGNGTATQRALDLLAEHGEMTYAQLNAGGMGSNSALTFLLQKGRIARTGFQDGSGKTKYRYRLADAPAAAPDAAPVNGHHADPPAPAGQKLQGTALVAFLLAEANNQPQTGPGFVAALQHVGHPIKNGLGVSGVLAKLSSQSLLSRTANGVYRITAKGKKRLDELQPTPPNLEG